MAGLNTRKTAWAPGPVLDALTKTDGADLAWMLAARCLGTDNTAANLPAILGTLLDEARILAHSDKPMQRAVKALAALKGKVDAGHTLRCQPHGRRTDAAHVAFLIGAGWRHSTDPDFAVCRPECRRAKPAGAS